MLGPFRKFSTSIYAKILLGIVVIPFVFWGMGSTFFGGNKNIVVVIDKEKYSIQQFSRFIDKNAGKKVESKDIDGLLSGFITEKLIEKEIDFYKIKLTDKSLSNLLKHQKNLKRDGEFSRTEYEKFLLENNITAVTFESLLARQEKKKQLLNLISGGLLPSNFLINMSYNKANQNRTIELLDLNFVFNKKLNFSEDEIKTYFNNNKNKYSEIYKTVNLIELNPKNILGEDEYNDIFFKKIDEIDDLIIMGEKFESIAQNFNLDKSNLYTINKLGDDINDKKIDNISESLIQKIFIKDEDESLFLLENDDKFFIVNVVKTENIEMVLEKETVRKKVILDLRRKTKRTLATKYIDKINKNQFDKLSFDKLSKDEKVNIQIINIKNQSDDSKLEKKILDQIYTYPAKSTILVNDIDFSKIYLVYIDKVKNVSIESNSDEYQKYLNISKNKIISTLYNTYDNYIKMRYKIDVNYQALDIVKNYYN